jgi:hypothetical protein
MPDYTCSDAAKFDPALREVPRVAQELFEEARPALRPGATLENVEFDTECNNPHSPSCTIKMVTVRRRQDGPNGNDVYVAFFANLTPKQQRTVRFAHDEAHLH